LEIKSFADIETSSQIAPSRTYYPFLTASIICISELPLKGGVPDNSI